MMAVNCYEVSRDCVSCAKNEVLLWAHRKQMPLFPETASLGAVGIYILGDLIKTNSREPFLARGHRPLFEAGADHPHEGNIGASGNASLHHQMGLDLLFANLDLGRKRKSVYLKVLLGHLQDLRNSQHLHHNIPLTGQRPNVKVQYVPTAGPTTLRG